jgi:hypothetical protein
MIPHPTQTDNDLRERAAALRATRYSCAWCARAKRRPLDVEVYQDDAGTIVLCRKCFLAFTLIASFYPITSRWQGWR